MGNREDLLAGARRVIAEQGIAKTTARDIATAAGVSLAAIGYHFGSKDRLVTEALVEALGTGIGDDLENLVLEGTGASLIDGFSTLVNELPSVFSDNKEALLASLENVVRVLRDPRESHKLHEAVAEGYRGMAENLVVAHPELEERQATSIARLYYVLTQSLGILWLLDPNSLPSGDELAEAVATIGETGTIPQHSTKMG
ncbi:TetR/AcrR family transcriptional regulator [Paramicrobacterium chengjingii]|uniref:TetR/AcrR family transcriptional regulator n=1 Tax=Paramicrobacterium chengjingii TaxID=2769067 RepID=A0ABX6YKL7_9MICO|nr:TetR/AcrR family transcriptional regulator [Microbacterium chengjingii]QPZ38882.1 TetR/AcrR family transcriptional regulator [Microbacterium chengjingii]